MANCDNLHSGLTSIEAAARLTSNGYNELPSTRKRNVFHIAFDVVREPMFLLLLACGIIYLASGELREAIMLLGFVFVVMGITFYQERKTERALEALRDLSSPRALVIRDGEQIRIAGREVVKGDIILLSEGDRVPADAVCLSCTNLTADESLLTGECVPVRKCGGSADSDKSRPGGDDLPFVFSGSLIVQGHGIAMVAATGMHTEIGKIGKALQSLEPETTHLQKETARLVTTFAVTGALLCAAVVIVYGLTRGHWMNGFLAGLSLAMAMLPEEFPVVLTVFLALGAWRISKHRVLTRRVPAIETLGSASVLCVDKTGTLTMNRMTVSDLYADNDFFGITPVNIDLPEKFHEVVEYAILASPRDPFDPMEKAMKELFDRTLIDTEHAHKSWELLREYPLSRELLAMSRVWRSPDGHDFVIAAKGAPEAIADLCHLSTEACAALVKRIEALSNNGRRVIGVAAAAFSDAALPLQQHDFNFRFLGLLGLEDPVRPGVAEAVDECYTAGIRTIMITGDYPGTAMHIGRQIGLKNPELFMTGHELATMNDETVKERIKTVNIFARMVPEQKLSLVNALKANGEIVAMTGDGVNDAPALKAAHIGIAMGQRGTDVAREAASLVLLDDDFNSIVKTIKMGRRIYDNLRKAMMYILSVHIPIAGMSLIPVLFKWPLALFPVHIVFLELIIDPACSVVFEAEDTEKDIMKRKPRNLHDPLFGKSAVITSLMQGLLIMTIVAGVYAFVMKSHGENAARALAFMTLVISNVGLIFANRSHTKSILKSFLQPNAALWWVTGGTCVLLAIALTVPFFHKLFRFDYFEIDDLFLCIGAGIFSIICVEILKLKMFRSKIKE